jgi:hypothetical protein
MRVAIFLICLFYLLLGGYNYVYTGSHHNSDSPVWHIKKNHAKFTKKNQGNPVVKETYPGQDDVFFITDDREEEDSDNLTARKYKLLAGHLYALAYAADVTNLYSRCKEPRPIHSLLSNKYITQRALRI